MSKVVGVFLPKGFDLLATATVKGEANVCTPAAGLKTNCPNFVSNLPRTACPLGASQWESLLLSDNPPPPGSQFQAHGICLLESKMQAPAAASHLSAYCSLETLLPTF